MDKRLETAIILFRKSYSGDISEAEQEELNTLLKNKELAQVYRKWMNNQLITESMEEEKRFPYMRGFKEFKSRITDTRLPERKNIIYRISAAAAAILILVTTVWYLQAPEDNKPKETIVRNTPSDIIPPGTKQAQLRLANGEIVQVNEAPLEIREQEGVHISYENGTIQYASAPEITELIYNELHTPAKGEFYVVLDDKTKVWINSSTHLKYPVKFVGKERRVVLTGEAFFEVSPDSKPFIVETSLGEIRVQGTSFDVKAYPDENMATTLVTGKVLYTGTQKMEIKPGEQLIASPSGEIEKKTVDTKEYTGWKDGLYVFNKKSLEQIMNDLERWYDITVVFETDRLKRVPFTGHLKRYDTINVFLDLLKETGEMNYRIQDNKITLY